jgi:hypothetical protein
MSAGPQPPYGYAQQPPPAPVCPRCGAQGYPGAERCHSCGKSYGGSSSLWWILGGATLLILLLVGGFALACGSLIGGASRLAGEGIDAGLNELERLQRQSSITQADYVSVKRGTGRGAVEARLGKPVEAGPDGVQTRLPDEPGGTTCIYYFERGQSLFAGPTYRFCFAGNRLVQKKVL